MSIPSPSQSQVASQNETVIAGEKRALELALTGAPLADVLDVLVRTIESQSSTEVLGSILLLDEAAGQLRHGAAPSLPKPYCEAIDGIHIGEGIGSCGTAAYTGHTVVVEDVQSHPYWAAFKELAGQHGLRACWSTPILSTAGKVLGTFALYHRVPAIPTERDREVVDLLAHTAALVIERDLHRARREAAEAELERERNEQAERLTAMFEYAPAAIAMLRGPEHSFEIANAKYIEVVGGRDVVGKPIRLALPELEGQGFYELLDNVRQSGVPFVGRAQHILLERNGGVEEAFFDFVYQPVGGTHGAQVIDRILVIAFEVTDLVRARLGAEKALARAEASEHALKIFIDNLPELAWTALPNGHIDYYNRRWYEYTGTTLEEMQGWGWEKIHDPALLPAVKERWSHSIETGEPFEMEFTLRGADGVRRWFLTRIVPVKNEAGEILRWFGTNTNIDDIKSAQALTAAMAEQSLEFQRALLAMRKEKEAVEARIASLESESNKQFA